MSDFSNLIKDARNPKWTSDKRSGINLDVLFSHIGDYIPFHATNYDDIQHGKFLFEQAAKGIYGDVADPAEPTREQIVSRNERYKSHLHSATERVIAPLERAIKLGIATDNESATLSAWERYSVLLSRVDTTLLDIDWPIAPSSVLR